MIEIRPALSYAIAYGHTFEEFLLMAHELGFKEVQLIPDQEPNLYSELMGDRLKRIIELKEQLGMVFYLHNVFYDINLVSLVPAVRDAAFEITRHVLALSRALGVENITVHPGYMFGGWRRDQVQRARFWRGAADALETLASLSEEHGIPILIENGSYYLCTATGSGKSPLHLAITPEELRHLVELSGDRLRICLDINKAIRSGRPIGEFLKLSSRFIDQLQLSTAPQYLAELKEILAGLSLHRDHISIVLEGSLGEVKEANDLLARIAEVNSGKSGV